MKDRLTDVLASGDTSAIVDLTSRIASQQAAQASAEEEEPAGPSAMPYRQATAQRQ